MFRSSRAKAHGVIALATVSIVGVFIAAAVEGHVRRTTDLGIRECLPIDVEESEQHHLDG